MDHLGDEGEGAKHTMTVLEAVNEILEAVGEPAITALDSGGTSEAAEAENHLLKSSLDIQKVGWTINTSKAVELTVPDTKLQTGISVGTFTYNETVSQAVSGATGTFAYEEGGYIYVRATVGGAAFNGSGLVTGGTSAATRTISSVATQTTGKIPNNPLGSSASTSGRWLAIKPDGQETKSFVPRGSFLYDNENNTYVWDDSLVVETFEYITFTDLTFALQKHIVADARKNFERFKRRGVFDSQLLAQEASAAKVAAMQEDSDLRATNVLNTTSAWSLRGNRQSEPDPNYA